MRGLTCPFHDTKDLEAPSPEGAVQNQRYREAKPPSFDEIFRNQSHAQASTETYAEKRSGPYTQTEGAIPLGRSFGWQLRISSTISSS
jgi:hypothetical protein